MKTPEEKAREYYKKYNRFIVAASKEEVISALIRIQKEAVQICDEEVKELREALKEIVEGVEKLPPLTAIAGMLEKQYRKAKQLLKEG